MTERWGVRYPKSGVHECLFGKKQAEDIWMLAIGHGIDATLVIDCGEGWEEVHL